jgi:hypothetical protein
VTIEGRYERAEDGRACFKDCKLIKVHEGPIRGAIIPSIKEGADQLADTQPDKTLTPIEQYDRAYRAQTKIGARGAVGRATQEWTGQLADGNLQKEKPVDGFITNNDDFAKLWKAWMGKQKLPEIDFDKELVMVASSSNSRVFEILLIVGKGDANAVVGRKAEEVKGFTFLIAVFNREAIKTIDGKAIEK